MWKRAGAGRSHPILMVPFYDGLPKSGSITPASAIGVIDRGLEEYSKNETATLLQKYSCWNNPIR